MKFRSGFIAITGRPNAGKSTLMNSLIGTPLSAVTPKAQTTRHRIKGILTADNFQMVFSDTPGILTPAYELHRKMLDEISHALDDADVVLLVDDVSAVIEDESVYSLAEHLKTPLVIALNKVDAADTTALENRTSFFIKKFPQAEIIPVSATGKFNLENLIRVLLKYMPEGHPFYPGEELSDRNQRFFAEEIIREKIFLNYEKEIPYSSETVITDWKESDTLAKIFAVIYVMRESQKAILLGHKGAAIRKMASQARKKLEIFTGKKVYLDLTVKVKPDWRNNDKFLNRLGYTDG